MVKLALDDNVPGSEHFKWREVLLLHEWGFHAMPEVEEYTNLVRVIHKLEWIRSILHTSIIITSGFRPQPYNLEIGGSIGSAHIRGMAIDWYAKYMSCNKVRQILIPYLDELNIRMENKPGSNWVHTDIKEPVNNRYFKP